MQITITHCRYTPKWETLQQMIQEATNNPKARLVKISRLDKGCNYRAPGVYTIAINQGNHTTLPITLVVEGV